MTLFLIAHKVRGSPAFDIAERCDDMGTPEDPGPWWIIPTSGHRAYPYSATAIEHLYMQPSGPAITFEDLTKRLVMPDPWPDHYESRHDPGAPQITASQIIRLISGPIKPVGRRPA